MMNLNLSQKEAVEHTEGPLLIIAGPGAGKTKTLVERIAYMIKIKKIDPQKILVSTFTERAARELLTRITDKLKDEEINLEDLYIGTIHSICLKIIDENIIFSKLNKGYKVLDNIDQKFFLFSKLKFFKQLSDFNQFFIEKEYLSNWRITEILLKWFNRFSESGIEIDDKSFLSEAYKLYKELLFSENKLDFSMIQLEAYNILNNNETVLKLFQEKIEYIMIDEYQDTNQIQEKIIFLIGKKSQNICVVGDDDQGIYRFRGATIKNILQFEKSFQIPCRVIKLETNYRSEKDIVNFCKEWMDSLYWGDFRHSKELEVPKEKDIDRTRVVKLSVDSSETKWQERVAKFLIFLMKTKKITDYNQVAFLFRSVKNRKIISLAHYLEHKGIGVYSPRSNLFFHRDETILIVGIFLYILLRPDSIYYNAKYKVDIFDYYKKCLNIVEKKINSDLKFKEEIELIKLEYENINKDIGNLLNLYYKIISITEFKKLFESTDYDILRNRELYNLGIFSKIIEKADNISKIKNITNENIIKIGDYLFTMHLKYLKQNGIDEYEDIKEYAPKGAVSFLTIHQSKGLEFPVVVVGSLESAPEQDKEEDEKLIKRYLLNNDFEPEYRIKDFDFWRLFYTAFSRAKNLLVLTCVEVSKGKRQVPSLPFKRVYEKLPDIGSGELSFKNLDIDKISDINLKEKFSYTGDLLKFQECPFKYRLNKIYDFQRFKTIENFYGILIHENLEYINKKLLLKDELDEEGVIAQYDVIYQSLKRSDNISLSENILKAGLEQIINYFNYIKKIKENIFEVEKTLYVFNENYIIEGKLDLILEENNGLRVIDFKTGNSELNEETLRSYTAQIKLYCYLLSKNTNKNILGGRIYFIKTNVEIDIEYKIGDEKELLENFKDITEKIRNNRFDKKRLDEKVCNKCEFKEHCFGVDML